MLQITPGALAELSYNRHVVHNHDTVPICPQESMQQCGALSGVPALWTWDTAIPHSHNSMRKAIHCDKSKATSSESVVASVFAAGTISTKNEPMNIEGHLRDIWKKESITAGLHSHVIHSQWVKGRLEIWNASKPERGKFVHCCLS